MTKERHTEKPSAGAFRGVLKTLIDLIFITFCAGFPTFYLYISNIQELYLHETAPLILIFSAVGWILYLILRLILRKFPRKAAIISGIVMAILTNAGMLTDALGYVVVLIISIVVIAAAFILIIRSKGGSVAEKIEFVVTGVIAALILFNIAISIPQFIENKRLSEEAFAKAASFEVIEVPEKYAAGDESLPNIYIFIFDELAGKTCMQEVFNYDNTWFYNDMRDLGFTVSDKCTNYRHFTFESFAGLLDMNYAFSYDEDGWLACREQFVNARFFSLMKEMGYDQYETEIEGLVSFEPRIDYGIGKEYCKTEDGYTTLDVVLCRTLFVPLINALGIIPSDYESYSDIFDYYADAENYTYKNAMTFSFICCPHAPFVFDANGNPVDDANRMNWTNTNYYLGQYEYICKRIVSTMKGVTENDPDAIILVLSDHGVKGNKYLWNGPATTDEQATDTFFAVYTGGRDDLGDITGLCGANVLSTVLNKEYGFDLDMIGPPEE